MTIDTIALVESPAQFLNLLEWVHAERAADRTVAMVLAPAEPTGREQLHQMAAFAAEEHVAVEWYDPRSSTPQRLQVVRQLAGRVSRARRLVVGDPFSGMIQALLVVARPRQVVVVDDGTATMEFASQLLSGEPLRRWDAPPAMMETLRTPLAWNARRFFRSDRVRIFTVMPVAGMPPHQINRHSYDWTRRRFGVPRTLPGVDIVGSSLVESGVVNEESYLAAISVLAARHGNQGRYYAHRREHDRKLDRIRQSTNLEVCRPTVPLEIELRRGPVAQVLASFPSSVGYTLPLVLAGVPTRVELQPVPTDMLTPRVGDAARRFLSRISADLRNNGGDQSTGHIAPMSI